ICYFGVRICYFSVLIYYFGVLIYYFGVRIYYFGDAWGSKLRVADAPEDVGAAIASILLWLWFENTP
ncbi:hypothetical protein, partial [uncultured Nostoc sp.]|uniref:hypothetical protein n=1 Tax=uncultured Nostoc sp. TaxID=340711 RepID=UPI0035C9C65C